jgi:glutamate dehydrogenase (NAD(P)+)
MAASARHPPSNGYRAFQVFSGTKKKIITRLVNIMKHAFAGLWGVAQNRKVSLSTATVILANQRILPTRDLRGLYP